MESVLELALLLPRSGFPVGFWLMGPDGAVACVQR